MSRGHSWNIDRPFLFLFLGITLVGLMMLWSASGPLAYQQFGNSFYFVRHQLLYGILPGLLLFFLFAIWNYRRWQPFALPFLVLTIVLLILVYLPGVGLHLGGSSRWVAFGSIRFQPSEFVKVTFLLYVAAWLAARHGKQDHTVEEGLLPFLITLGAVLLLLIKQPNTGSTMVVAGSALFAYFVAGAPIAWFIGLATLGAGGVAALIKFTPYRAARFMTFLHPELDPKGIGYQINQAYLAIGSGGLFGLGYGHSRQKYLYLPEVAGDSIFAVMAEELGLLVVLLFLVAYAFLVWRCFKIARESTDPFGRFLVTGIGAWWAIQAFLNIASMIGLMPVTGVTLPFISYGSSSFIALAVSAGLVASVSRFGRRT